MVSSQRWRHHGLGLVSVPGMMMMMFGVLVKCHGKSPAKYVVNFGRHIEKWNSNCNRFKINIWYDHLMWWTPGTKNMAGKSASIKTGISPLGLPEGIRINIPIFVVSIPINHQKIQWIPIEPWASNLGAAWIWGWNQGHALDAWWGPGPRGRWGRQKMLMI